MTALKSKDSITSLSEQQNQVLLVAASLNKMLHQLLLVAASLKKMLHEKIRDKKLKRAGFLVNTEASLQAFFEIDIPKRKTKYLKDIPKEKQNT